MSTTISMTGNPPDIDGTYATGIRSLEQRIHAAFHFRWGEWFLRTGEGVRYDIVFKHQSNLNQILQFFISVIRQEGGTEINEISDAIYEYDNKTRQFIFQCNINTIYGDIEFKEQING